MAADGGNRFNITLFTYNGAEGLLKFCRLIFNFIFFKCLFRDSWHCCVLTSTPAVDLPLLLEMFGIGGIN